MPTLSRDQLDQHLMMRFQQAGASEVSARATVDALMLAEADGIGSHGLSRVPAYLAQLASGKVRGAVLPEVNAGDAGLIRVDARFGFAFPAIEAGLQAAFEALQAQAIVLLLIGHSHHAGVLGHPVEKAARRGYLAIGFTNTPAAIAPWGGSKALFGTNPLAFACPRAGESEPLAIDLSVSAVARGKVVQAKKAGRQIPDDWAFDADGLPTTDPERALAGSMRPMGDAKGAALALMIEILAAALTGSRYGHEASSFLDADGDPPGVGQCFFLIDPSKITDGFLGRVEDLLTAMLAQDGTRLPGERRFAQRHDTFEQGFSIDDRLWAELGLGESADG